LNREIIVNRDSQEEVTHAPRRLPRGSERRDDRPGSPLAFAIRSRTPVRSCCPGDWWELNFITGAPIRQFKDFIFFERAEPPRFMRPSDFDFTRAEDKDAIAPSKIEQLRVVYLARAKKIEAN
jgi:hypothetical protein